MKGLIIVGSSRVGSHTNALAKYLIGQLDEHDVDVDIFDLAEKPIHQLDFSGTTQAAEDIKKMLKSFRIKQWKRISLFLERLIIMAHFLAYLRTL